MELVSGCAVGAARDEEKTKRLTPLRKMHRGEMVDVIGKPGDRFMCSRAYSSH